MRLSTKRVALTCWTLVLTWVWLAAGSPAGADLFVVPFGTSGSWNVYETVTTSDNWNNANTAAQAKTDPLFGTATTGNLVRIDSATENAFIAGFIGGTSYWIGAHDQVTEGDWHWTSGSPTLFWQGAAGGTPQNGLYSNWGGGEPNDWGGNEDAAQIYGGSGRWNDLDVAASQPYIVEYLTNASLVDATTTPQPMTLNPLDGRYYQAVGTTMTWANAKALAESRQFQGTQGRLVRIGDAMKNGFVQTLLRDSGGDGWIGLTDAEGFGGSESIGQPNPQVDGWVWSGPADTAGAWQAVPLASTGYTNWNSGEPNGTTEDQVQFISGTGRWNDLAGSSQLRSVIEYGHTPIARNFLVREVKMNGSFGQDVNAVRNLLNGQVPTLGETVCSYAALNLRDPNDGGGGNFLGRAPFPGETPGADDNNFAIRAKASIVIPTAGDWTFAAARDDIYELVVERGADPVATSSGTCCGTSLMTVNFAQPGTYSFYALFGEIGGGAYFDVSAAPGALGAFDGTFRLIGDTVNGGLATAPAREIGISEHTRFTVRRVSSTGSVGNLTDVDNLLDNGLPGIASQDSGIFNSVNFLSTGGNGHFGLDDPFPGFSIGTDDNNFAVEASGTLRVPAGSDGWWTFGVNSDDGFRLTIAGLSGVIPFDSVAGQSGTTIVGGSLVFPIGRGTDDSFGRIYLPVGEYSLTLRFWEGGGGAALELFAAPGIHSSFNGAFEVLSTIAAPEPSTLLLSLLGVLALIGLRCRRYT